MAHSPNFANMPDFQKVRFLEERLRDRNDELSDKHGEVLSYKNKFEALNADLYDYQRKTQQLENDNRDLREKVTRLEVQAPREVRILHGQLKRMEGERGKLLKSLGNKEEAIETIRRGRDKDIRDFEAEIKELDETLTARNVEVNGLTHTCREQREKIKTLEQAVDVEKRTGDNYKVASEKYEAAGPALERLNKILAKYFGDRLENGLAWPPGHPNNKIDKALNALEDELARIKTKEGTAAVAVPTTVEDTAKQEPAHDDVKSSPPAFDIPETDTMNNMTGLTLKEQLAANIALRDRLLHSRRSGESSRSAAGSFNDNDSASLNEKKSKTSKFKEAMSNAFKGRHEHENDFIPESSLLHTAQGETTPTSTAKRPGINTNVPGRNFTLFETATSAVEDDSPKPSEKLFGDLDGKRPRSSRYTNRLVPEAEPQIVYRDREVIKEVIKWRDCDKKHVDDISPVSCSRLHVEDCARPHIEDMSDSDDEEEKKEKEKKIEYVEVPVPCSKKHVNERTTEKRPVKGLAVQTDMTRENIEELLRLANQTPTTAAADLDQIIQEKAVEKPVEKIVYKNRIVEKQVETIVEKIVEKQVIKYKYQDRVVWMPRHPLKTIFYFYFDVWVCLVEWMWRRTPRVVRFLERVLGAKLSYYLITKALDGHTYEIVHLENDFNSLQSARHAILRRTNGEHLGPIKDNEPSLIEQIEKNSKNGKATLPSLSASPSIIGLMQPAGTSSSTTIDVSPSSTTSSATAIAPKSDTEHYITATQYVVHRPLFISNLIMAMFFLTLIPLTIWTSLIVYEYTSLLQFQGADLPQWFSLPYLDSYRCRYGYGGYGCSGEVDGGLFLVDRDWSWMKYLWKAVTGGWLRQLRWHLTTYASGGAGWVMPG